MSERLEERCHWSGERRVTRRHRRDCAVPGCEGCEPCTRPHCVMPRCAHHLRDHEPRVCDHCVGLVRAGLERLVRLCGFAPYVAATYSFVSPVAVLVGPVPEHSTHQARREWALGGRLCRCTEDGRPCPDRAPEPQGPECRDWQACEHYTCRRRTGQPTCPALVEWLELVDDERHPRWVLESWDRLVAEHLGHRRTLRVTVNTAASYLAANLTDLARLEDFGFEDLAAEIAACVEHVETVLLLALRAETGAPCPVCFTQGRKPKDLIREFEEDDVTGDSDRWVCPRPECGQTWTLEEYEKFVAGEYVQHADRLPLSAMATRTRVAGGTLRRWSLLGRIKPCGHAEDGSKVYRVADVLAVRDEKAVG